jgi:hypothetical protein
MILTKPIATFLNNVTDALLSVMAKVCFTALLREFSQTQLAIGAVGINGA